MSSQSAWISWSLAAALGAVTPPPASAGTCTLQSPPHRVAVVELYTSEVRDLSGEQRLAESGRD